jgi:hypothetical protein
MSDHTHTYGAKCNYGFCNRFFPSPQELLIHNQKHNHRGRHKCPHCNFTSNNKDKYNAHVESHDQRHWSIYNGTRPNSNLKTPVNIGMIPHRYNYVRPRPYTCLYDGCKYKGVSSAAARLHLKLKHQDAFSAQDYEAIISLATLKTIVKYQEEIVVDVEEESIIDLEN